MSGWPIGAFLIVALLGFFSLIGYMLHNTHECQIAAIQQGMSAIEIQAACK